MPYPAASSVLELQNINYPTFKLKFGGYYAPNRIYSTGSFRFYSSYPYTNADSIMAVGTIPDYNNPSSTGEIIYMSLNTQGLALTGYLNVSGTTTLNNATTCMSSLMLQVTLLMVNQIQNSLNFKMILTHYYKKKKN